MTNLVKMFVFLGVLAAGCGVIKKRPPGEQERVLPPENMTPEEARAMLKEKGEDWLYGEGLGKTAINIGGVVAFPPYAVYLLGNSLLTMGGYENVYVTDALPKEERSQWEMAYEQIAGIPGRAAAAAAGKEYRGEEKKRTEGAEKNTGDNDDDFDESELWHNSDL